MKQEDRIAADVLVPELDPAHDVADFLKVIPIFSGLDDNLRSVIATEVGTVDVRAGEWLFRIDDPADGLFVVQWGRLQVVSEPPDLKPISVLGRGSVVGELALLFESPRSASVRAVRDSRLLRITRDRFDRLVNDVPGFAVALMRELGRQLKGSRPIEVVTRVRPSTVALVAMEKGLPLETAERDLVATLSSWNRIALLSGPPDRIGNDVRPAAAGEMLDRAEREHDQVILSSDAGLDAPWTRFCLDQADTVIALTTGRSPRPPTPTPRLHGCHLVFTGRGSNPKTLQPLLHALQPEVVYGSGARSDLGASMHAIARRLAGRSVGLVLSGGGARALVQIGVLEELDAAGIQIDRVGGTSMGAVIGGMYAMGRSPREIRDILYEELAENNAFNDYTVPLVALLRGANLQASLERVFGTTLIEEFNQSFFSVCCDLVSRDVVVHHSGPALAAIRASVGLPGILPPIRAGERILVDGGVRNNLPVDLMAASGEGPVIAVDVGAAFDAPSVGRSGPDRTPESSLTKRVRRGVTGTAGAVPGFTDTLMRSFLLGSVDTARAAQQFADLVVLPDPGEVGLLEFKAMDRMRHAGRAACRKALHTQEGMSLLARL